MICISKGVLSDMGFRGTIAEALHTIFRDTGVLPCTFFEFNKPEEGEHHGMRPSAWLAEEAKPRLLLIGMSDRFGEGRRIAESVLEVAVAASGLYHREPTSEETGQLRSLILSYGWAYSEKAAALLGFY